MNHNHHQQQSTIPDPSTSDEWEKILADIATTPIDTSDIMTPAVNHVTTDDFDIDALINIPHHELQALQFTHDPIVYDGTSSLLDDPSNTFILDQQIHSTFIDTNDSPHISEQSSYSFGDSPAEPNAIEISLRTQAVLQQQHELIRRAAQSKKSKNNTARPTTTVEPIDYPRNSNGCQPCTTVQMYNDFASQQQMLEYDTFQSKRIQIKSQPRAKYRPRTHNESKNSAHYIRCEEGVKPEYPTILIPHEWNFQSDINLIEVTLVGIDKQPHPYTIDNKNSSNTFEDNALIFRQNDQNVLYFRLTDDDFRNGYKTFMIEMIKSKQDHIITKDLIRTRQLEHSMLRFTRIFQMGKGQFERDEGSTEYSCVMSEAYGDIEVEHLGPRYGPMTGQEMVYVVLKGRILKSDLKVEVFEPMSSWQQSIENFTKNGNIIYFLMPPFPLPQFDTIKTEIIIYYKDEEFHRTTYLYKGSLDQELAALHLNDSSAALTSSMPIPNCFNAFEFLSATDFCSNLSSRKKPSPKAPKRLKKV